MVGKSAPVYLKKKNAADLPCKSFGSVHGETRLKIWWVVKKSVFSFTQGVECINFNQNTFFRIIWKFNLSSREVLGRIYTLIIEILLQKNDAKLTDSHQFVMFFFIYCPVTANAKLCPLPSYHFIITILIASLMSRRKAFYVKTYDNHFDCICHIEEKSVLCKNLW